MFCLFFVNFSIFAVFWKLTEAEEKSIAGVAIDDKGKKKKRKASTDEEVESAKGYII